MVGGEIVGKNVAAACHGGEEETGGRKGESRQGLRVDLRADLHGDRRGAYRKESYPRGQMERVGIESGDGQEPHGGVGI